MIRTILLASAALALTTNAYAAAPKKAARPAAAATLPASNPFAKPSTLPFQAPDFSKIKDTDYLPAILAGMAQQKREVLAIANNPAPATFNNTIVALERSGALLERAGLAFSAVNGANTNDTLQATDTKTAPLYAEHGDFINLNAKLFARVKSLHDQQASLNLNPEQAKLLDVYYKGMVHAGAELSPEKQTQLKAMNKRLSTLQTEFSQKLLAAAKAGALHVTDKAALAGLSDAQIAAAAEAAKDRKLAGYVLPLQNTTQQPSLESLTSHATRQQLFDASLNRAEHGDANDTRGIISEIAQLRAKKAALFGAANFADYTLYDQMAKDRATAIGFLDRLAPAVSAKERTEWSDIVALAKSQAADFQPTAADWNFYAEQIRKQRYALDSDQVKQYFEFNKVLEDGVFYAANQLYGLTFKERKDLPTWNPDMRVFEVHDQDGNRSGTLIIVGDTVHNFVDGVLIAAAFLQSTELGVVTAVAIIAHEIPQEVGDFLILLHSGYTRVRALILNLVSSLATVLGGLVGYFALQLIQGLEATLLGIVAASMIYVAVADLIPGLHRRPELKDTASQALLIALGIGTIAMVRAALPH